MGWWGGGVCVGGRSLRGRSYWDLFGGLFFLFDF